MPADGVKAAPEYKNDPAEDKIFFGNMVGPQPTQVPKKSLVLGGVILIFRCGLHSVGWHGSTGYGEAST